MNASPLPITQLSHQKANTIRYILFDFDDTVTWKGQMPLDSSKAIAKAHAAGLMLIAVTGRSASWAEMLMRLFPFEAAIAETGALCYHRETLDGPIRVLHSNPSPEDREQLRAQRIQIAQKIMATHSEVRFALDNPGRIYDSAFDLVEDGPSVSQETIEAIHQHLENAGLYWAQSSVHINFFQSEFNKAEMVQRYFKQIKNYDWSHIMPSIAYLGDSTNDGPLFTSVDLSIGVANIAPYLPQLAQNGQMPKYITTHKGGHGFAEAIDILINLQKPPP